MAKDNTTLTEKQLVLFDLGGELYGVDIAVVHEIIRMQPITRVPKVPSFVEGIINLRGKIIPMVDMRKRFELKKIERNNDNRILVIDSGGQSIGIIVDAVTEVLRIPVDSVEPASDIITSASSDYVMGIAKRNGDMIILLDLDKALGKEAVASLMNQSLDVRRDEGSNPPEKALEMENPVEVQAEQALDGLKVVQCEESTVALASETD